MKNRLQHIILCWLMTLSASAQDPHFSQFFSAPFAVNPALTGVIDGDWRAVSNIRQQWIGPGYPYSTATLCFDGKLAKNKLGESQVLSLGGMCMYDRTMGGIFNSIYANANAAYHLSFDEDNSQWLGIGFGLTYGSRRIDFSKLVFAEQFTSNGFNTSLPTGETSLSNIKPYWSVSSGILYGYRTENSNINIGASMYHINTPKQTALKDDNQRLPRRYVGYFDLNTSLTEQLSIFGSGLYQTQSGSSYYAFGTALGYNLSRTDQMAAIYLGAIYRSDDAVVPYTGFALNNWQLGISYDATLSYLSHANRPPKSWELSLIIRQPSEKPKSIPCPWR